MNRSTTLNLIIILFLSLALAIGVFSASQRQPIFSEQSLLESTWYHYKQDYLEPGTLRALDKQRNNLTTSEGQSYTLLRAIWMDDKPTFDAAWQWTKDNLQRPDDRLFSWLFGERPDGSYGIMVEEGGENTATDADVDIALALLFASERWGDPEYFGDAIVIIHDIWENEVMVVNGQPYLVANNLEKTSTRSTALLNPSYFAPYAYRIFALVDPEHDWLGVVDTSYQILETSSADELDTPTSANLPPDWVEIHKKTGRLSAPDASRGLTTNYGYDALRTPWRVALDAHWFNDPRAYEVLEQWVFLSETWEKNQSLASIYTHDGQAARQDMSHAIYGGALGQLLFTKPQTATDMYTDRLENLYNSSTFTWHEPLSYYDANWVWFGMALYYGKLPNLYSPSLTAYETPNLTFNLLPHIQ